MKMRNPMIKIPITQVQNTITGTAGSTHVVADYSRAAGRYGLGTGNPVTLNDGASTPWRTYGRWMLGWGGAQGLSRGRITGDDR